MGGLSLRYCALAVASVASVVACGDSGVLVEIRTSGEVELDSLELMVWRTLRDRAAIQPPDRADVRGRDLSSSPFRYYIEPGSRGQSQIAIGAIGLRGEQPVVGGLLQDIRFQGDAVLEYELLLEPGAFEVNYDCLSLNGTELPLEPGLYCSDGPRPCEEIEGGSQIVDNPEGPIFCDMETDGGQWTLVASFVVSDWVRGWSGLEALLAGGEFGSAENSEFSDYRSWAFDAVPARDLLISTSEYAFAFHGLIDGRPLGQFLEGRWPDGCHSSWMRRGADYAAGIPADLLPLLGFRLRPRAPSGDGCYPDGGDTTAICFMPGETFCHGVALNGASGETAIMDHSMVTPNAFTIQDCNTGGTCADGGQLTTTDNGPLGKTNYVKLYVR